MASVSIIITTRNRAEDVRKTLAAMRDVVVPSGWSVELMVVDNASTDHTPEVIASCDVPQMTVRHVSEPRPGKSIALNTALGIASGDIFLFTDDDVRVPRNWVERMCDPILAGRAEAVCGGVRLAPELDQPWLTGELRVWVADTYWMDPNHAYIFIGANAALSRRIFDVIPQFDAELGPGKYGFMDDVLLAMQVKTAGMRIESALDCSVEHHFDASRLTREHIVRQSRNHGASRAYVEYHWHHSAANPTFLRIAKAGLAVAASQIAGYFKRNNPRPVTEWELKSLVKWWFWQQYLKEQRLPRKYAKNGLVKLDYVAPDRTTSEDARTIKATP